MEKEALEKVHLPRSLDLSGAARGVWIVKVPKYLSEKWRQSGTNKDVGKLRITMPRVAGGKQQVIFTLNDELANSKNPDGTQGKVPKDHKFVLTGVGPQSLAVLSQEQGEMPPGAGLEQFSEKVAVEGRVMQRAECRPMADTSYMNLNRERMEKSNKPTREMKHIDRAVVNYKPKSFHSGQQEADRKKKDGTQRVRMDKDKVMDMLYSAFEKHQYYNFKDLVRITAQPVAYLKELLQEICNYNMKAPHKNMWELKPEFRHYKSQDG